jgi:diketogulonate reductase-like aldo/keto reductase
MGMMTVMKEIILNGGGRMPIVGFGTWQLHGRSAYEATRYALGVGYRHIDTATMYGNEAEVGRALRDSGLGRDEVFITTKLPPRNVGKERATIAAGLESLGTDHVDLWLIHWPPRRGASVSVWREFIAARDAGQARSIGVSNYSPDEIDELTSATGVTPAVNQIPWSPSQYDAKLLDAHRARKVAMEGYSPLKGSNLRDRVLNEIADAHRVTAAQVILRWHVEHDIVVIPRSKRSERIAANFDLDGFSLSPEEVARIDALGRS